MITCDHRKKADLEVAHLLQEAALCVILLASTLTSLCFTLAVVIRLM